MRSPYSASVFQDRTYQALITIAFDMSGTLTEVALKITFNINNSLASNLINMFIP